MSVSIKDIYDVLNAQVATLSGFDAANTAFPGVKYSPEAEQPYLALSMPAVKGHNITLGQTGVYEWSGIYQVQCNWPIGGGTEEVGSQVNDIMELFPNGLSLVTPSGFYIRFFAPDPKPITFDDAWVRGVVQIPWFLHEVRT